MKNRNFYYSMKLVFDPDNIYLSNTGIILSIMKIFMYISMITLLPKAIWHYILGEKMPWYKFIMVWIIGIILGALTIMYFFEDYKSINRIILFLVDFYYTSVFTLYLSMFKSTKK